MQTIKIFLENLWALFPIIHYVKSSMTMPRIQEKSIDVDVGMRKE